MQAVILAAGRGTRMNSLTDTTPKPLLTVLGKTLLEHKILELPPEVDEVVLVVGYLGDAIKKHFGSSWNGKKITYVDMPNLLGTGHALHDARPFLKDRFMVMMGDDLYSRGDMEKALKHEWSILVDKVKERRRGARTLFGESGQLVDIIEGQELLPGMHSNAGLYVLGREFFDVPLVRIPSGEFGLPQTLLQLVPFKNIVVIEADFWFPISNPEDIEKAESLLGKNGNK